MIDEEIAICEQKKTMLKKKQLQYIKFVQSLLQQFQIPVSTFTNANKIKLAEMQAKKEREMHRQKYAAIVKKVFATRAKSKLYCDFYYPDRYEKANGKEATYNAFGFDWPQENDMLDMCVKYQIEPKDFRLDRIMWKKDGCGFGMLQLGFGEETKCIVSPQFRCERHDEENFMTTYLKHDKGRLNHISVNVAEEKFVENIGLLHAHAAGLPLAAQQNGQPCQPDDNVIAKLLPCKGCGQDQIYNIPAGHSLVGIFGFLKTNKYLPEG
jgi:hypothetical protein